MASLSRASVVGVAALRTASTSLASRALPAARRPLLAVAARGMAGKTVHVPGGATEGIPDNAFTPSKMPLASVRTLFGINNGLVRAGRNIDHIKHNYHHLDGYTFLKYGTKDKVYLGIVAVLVFTCLMIAVRGLRSMMLMQNKRDTA